MITDYDALLDTLYVAIAIEDDLETALDALCAAFDAAGRIDAAAAGGDLLLQLSGDAADRAIVLSRPAGPDFSAAERDAARVLEAHLRRAFQLRRTAHELLEQTDALARLTPAERRIVQALRAGLSYPAICRREAISINTLKWHLRHIFQKLDVAGRDELVARLGSPRSHSVLGLK